MKKSKLFTLILCIGFLSSIQSQTEKVEKKKTTIVNSAYDFLKNRNFNEGYAALAVFEAAAAIYSANLLAKEANLFYQQGFNTLNRTPYMCIFTLFSGYFAKNSARSFKKAFEKDKAIETK